MYVMLSIRFAFQSNTRPSKYRDRWHFCISWLHCSRFRRRFS